MKKHCFKNLGMTIRNRLHDDIYDHSTAIDFTTLLVYLGNIRTEMPINPNPNNLSELHLHNALKMVTAYRVGFCSIHIDDPNSDRLIYLEKCLSMDYETLLKIDKDLSNKCILDPDKTYNTFDEKDFELAFELISELSKSLKIDKKNVAYPVVEKRPTPLAKRPTYIDAMLVSQASSFVWRGNYEDAIVVEFHANPIRGSNIFFPHGRVLNPDTESQSLLDSLLS